jgi:hypothetical protein
VHRRFFAAALVGALGCTSAASIPDPKVAAEEYAGAAERGDADALWGMLSKRSRATMSKAEVDKIVHDAKLELVDQAKAVRAAAGGIIAVARLRFEDGSEASLTLKDGKFWVATTGMLSGGSTPEEALAGLRDTLKRRSYPALLRLLTPALRAAVEAQLKGLVEALENPSALQIPPGAGEEVEVKLSNGHKVKLRREQGTWYVENFE